MQTKFHIDVEPTSKNSIPVSIVNPIIQYSNRYAIEGHVVIDDKVIDMSDYDIVSRSEATDNSITIETKPTEDLNIVIENNNDVIIDNIIKHETNESQTLSKTIGKNQNQKKIMTLSSKNPFKDDIDFYKFKDA
jgi:hypothetical protein